MFAGGTTCLNDANDRSRPLTFYFRPRYFEIRDVDEAM